MVLRELYYAALPVVLRELYGAQGLVLLDDTDISTYDPSWLHYQIALVSQVWFPLSFSCFSSFSFLSLSLSLSRFFLGPPLPCSSHARY